MIPDILGFDRVWPTLLTALIAGFALGSTPTAILLARALGLPDPRSIGSGNIGASNMARSAGWRVGLATLLLDAAKGWVPATAAFFLAGPLAAGCAGFGAFLGHCFSPWIGFKGGKGVATGFGALIAWRWEVALICAGAWLGVALLTRIASASSLTAAAAAVLGFFHLNEGDYLLFVIGMALILIWRHAANIGRFAARRGA